MDEYRVDTPENIVFSYDVSGIGSRFLAALIDSAIILVLLIIVYVTTAAILSTSAGQSLVSNLARSWIIAGYLLLTFSIYWAYYIFFELIWNGQSPGKRAAGLRVIRTDGTPVTVVDSVVRNIVRLVDFMPTFYGVGIIVMLINSQSRRLGDLAAGTVVIKERREMTLAHLTQSARQVVAPAPAFLPAEAALWPVERLTEDDYYVVNEFFARRDKIVNADALACRLATALRAKLDLASAQPLAGAEAVQFLAQIAAVYRSQGSAGAVSVQFVCPQCGSSVNEGALRCLVCGMQFKLSCPRCGTTIAQHDVACPNCGTAFDQSMKPVREVVQPMARQAQPVSQPAVSVSPGEASVARDVLICPRCHAAASGGVETCPACGLDLSGRCPKCRTPLPDGADICPSCGQSVCPQCHSMVEEAAMACPICGAQFTLLCPRCGGTVMAWDKTCPKCGETFN